MCHKKLACNHSTTFSDDLLPQSDDLLPQSADLLPQSADPQPDPDSGDALVPSPVSSDVDHSSCDVIARH